MLEERIARASAPESESGRGRLPVEHSAPAPTSAHSDSAGETGGDTKPKRRWWRRGSPRG